MSRRALLLALSLAVAAPSIAHAQGEPSASDIDSARTAFQQALDLRDKQHDLRGAIEKLKAAYALVPTPRIGFELGKTYRGAGQLVEARAAFLDVDRLPVKKNESAEAKKARDEARAAASELDAKVPSLVIHLTGPGQVAIDGETLRRDALAVPRRLNPGRHLVSVMVDGVAQSQKVVDLREGESRDVELQASAPSDTSDDDDTTAPNTGPTVRPTPRPAGYVPPVDSTPKTANGSRIAMLTVGYLGMGFGLASDLVAYAVTSGAQSKCDTTSKVCGDLSGKNTALAFAIAGDALVGVGAIFWIIGIAMPKEVAVAAPSVGFQPLDGGGYLSAGGRF